MYGTIYSYCQSVSSLYVDFRPCTTRRGTPTWILNWRTYWSLKTEHLNFATSVSQHVLIKLWIAPWERHYIWHLRYTMHLRSLANHSPPTYSHSECFSLCWRLEHLRSTRLSVPTATSVTWRWNQETQSSLNTIRTHTIFTMMVKYPRASWIFWSRCSWWILSSVSRMSASCSSSIFSKMRCVTAPTWRKSLRKLLKNFSQRVKVCLRNMKTDGKNQYEEIW